MDIILDTNIYQANFSLKGNQMDTLSAYLKKTDDHLVIPYIVAQELLRNYRSSLEKTIKDAEKAARPFYNCVTTPELKRIADTIYSLEQYRQKNLDGDAANYLNYVKATIEKASIQETLPSLNFDKIVAKGLDKVKPFKASGEGMKDAILWESILDHCERGKLKRLIFISNNSNDFGKDVLEENLLEQMRASSLEIVYYNGLQAFIDNEFATVSGITLTIPDIDEQTLKILLGYKINKTFNLQAFYDQHSTANDKYSDFQGINTFDIMEVEHFIVKDIDADFKYLHARLVCKTGFVLAHESYRPYTNHYTGDFDFDYDVELDEVFAKLSLDISLKLTANGFEDLELNSASFI